MLQVNPQSDALVIEDFTSIGDFLSCQFETHGRDKETFSIITEPSGENSYSQNVRIDFSQPYWFEVSRDETLLIHTDLTGLLERHPPLHNGYGVTVSNSSSLSEFAHLHSGSTFRDELKLYQIVSKYKGFIKVLSATRPSFTVLNYAH